MGSTDRYVLAGRKVRIVFSWDEGLGSIQRVEIDGQGELTALVVRVRGAPSKWTRRVTGPDLRALLELFREVDFFSVVERPVLRIGRGRVRRELSLVIGGRVNRICDGLPGPRAGTVLRPARCLERIYQAIERLAGEGAAPVASQA
jgi:hypothetical protein